MAIRQIMTPYDFPKNTSWRDDPVRPELSLDFRQNFYRQMYTNSGKAIVCVAWCTDVPTTVEELTKYSSIGVTSKPDIAVFYTIWSYEKGGARDLLMTLLDMYETSSYRFVTMSPKTEMATKFHLKNGAFLLSANEETDNFEYKLS